MELLLKFFSQLLIPSHQKGQDIVKKGPKQLEDGFGAHSTIMIIRNPQNGIGNYLGPYISHQKSQDIVTRRIRAA